MNALTFHGYADWLEALKRHIASARGRAALAANAELVRLYWQIGREILERQEQQGWGAKVIDRLARDLKDAFPDMKGFSTRNLKYMQYFAQQCPDMQIGQQPAAQMPWFHIVTLLTKLEAPAERRAAIPPGSGRRRILHRPALLSHPPQALRRGGTQGGGLQTRTCRSAQLLPRVRALPESLDTSLPSIEEIEAELAEEWREGGIG